MQYAVKVKRHNVVRGGPLSWIPGMWFSRNVNFACKFHWRWHAVFGSSHNSEIYNIGARAQYTGLHEPGNHDNGASDLWTLTAYRALMHKHNNAYWLTVNISLTCVNMHRL